MSLELVRESTKVNYVVGEELAQTIVEHDIIVPDVNPDVARILLIDGEIREGDSEASQDRIHVDGTIYYKILYVSDDPEANSRAGMKAKVKCDIEHIDYEILNGRKINAKTILRIYAKAVKRTTWIYTVILERTLLIALPSVKIVGKDYRISDDKIIAKGDINILTLYIGDNEERSIQFMDSRHK